MKDLEKKFRISDDIDALALAAAKHFVELANKTIAEKGSFKVALSGGNTPKSLFDILAKNKEYKLEDIAWDKVHLFWGDERYVPYDSPQSNYLMTEQHLLNKVSIPKENVHPFPTDEKDPKEAALLYADALRKEFQLKTKEEIPSFDLVYLGMGPEGHTASLFPDTDLVKNIVAEKTSPTELVAAVWVAKFNMYRVSLLSRVINNAGTIVFLVGGVDKAPILKDIIKGPYQPLVHPVQLIKAKAGSNEIWFVDKAAISMLK